ncbi:11S globulin seed storage protein 1 [Euphorbia peplus]|nr:11S globulin seed storage protein 1 [Euphorbia peplus]
MSSKTKFQEIPQLLDMEPDMYFPSEAGSVEIWNLTDGLYVGRYTIQPNGLMLSFYTNADEFAYMLKGKFLTGLFIRGCSRKSNAECRQFYRFRMGDVGSRNGGEFLWNYNDTNETVIIIAVLRTTNKESLRVFLLGGPQNLLGGFGLEYLSEAFNVDSDLARKLQNKDLRGNIIYLTPGGIDLSNVPIIQSCPRKDQQGKKRVVDESFCNAYDTRVEKLHDPLMVVDIGLLEKINGIFTTIDSQEFPILQSTQYSVSYTLLLKDVIRLPHWENSDRIILVVKGEGWIQVVDNNGTNVFDNIVKEGQFLTVPKFLVMTEKSKTEFFEYVIFMTNANPISFDIAGRNSVVHGLPLEVLTNAFNITEEEALKVKFARKETSLAKIMPKDV